MAARELFTPGFGAGALTAPGTDSIHVQEVSLSLDFRELGRQPSMAEYVLVNRHPTQIWEDELIFVSTAPTVTITVDGVPTQVTSYGTRFSQREQAVRDLGTGLKGNGFRLRLLPGQARLVAVRFLCAPGTYQRNTAAETRFDGLLRLELFHRTEVRDDRHDYSYPLWPAYGFAGGTGAMAITLLTGSGAQPPESAALATWTAQPLPEGDTRWTVRLPAARSITNAPMRDVYVRYPQPRLSRWHFGSSVFAGVRFAGQNEKVAAPHLSVSADLVHERAGAFMLGGETEFAHSLSLSLAFQHGPVNQYVSAYLGGAVLATFTPAVVPGFELRAGARLLYLPLDLAFQLHPWVTPGEGHVALWRVIVGLRVGVW